MTLRELLTEGRRHLQECQVPDFEWDASLLLFHIFGIDRGFYYLHEKETIEALGLDAQCVERFKEAIDKRGKRVPLQHIIGTTEFMGMPFSVNENVLSPRQDTECLVEAVLEKCEGKTVLDLCTGSGCIAISIAKLGKPASVMAIDLSKEALQIAKSNAKMNDTEIEFLMSDLFSNCTEKFDFIVSNPPYIKSDVIDTLMPEVKDHEPRMALDGDEDGLYFYRKIISQAGEHLNPEGEIYFEIGYDQGDEVKALFENKGYENIRCIKDLAGLDRVVIAKKRKENENV